MTEMLEARPSGPREEDVSELEASSLSWFHTFLAPVTMAAFLQDVWEQKSLCWEPAGACAVRPWFTFEDAQARLCFSPNVPRDVRMVFYGRTLSPENYANPSGIVEFDRVQELL